MRLIGRRNLLKSPRSPASFAPQICPEVPMSPMPRMRFYATLAIVAALSTCCANAQESPIKHVFVIAMENHNWTQPTTVAGGIEQIYQNPNAPFINSLVNGTTRAYINGQVVNISKQVSY